ncbi:hemerythrin [Geomonas silvestris]|uniref:Hemerythrin n=1 Tax=Geomonas silvestris TaxID=2740184 RepID=A0A6V8MFX2_9BACT|nr:hemerythrin domain-containing protein [Geomonas silvestris]GFO58900.1 hemerythrin [Geomonas silvestris]
MGNSAGKDRAAPEPVLGDGLDVLRSDHSRIRQLFELIEKTEPAELAERKELFFTLQEELLAHLEAEERFFYTALEQNDEARTRILEGYEEHQLARLVIGAFTSLAGDDARWTAKLSVLKKLITRHMDEEEQELFALGKKVFSQEELQGLSRKVQEAKLSAQTKASSAKEAG